MWEKNRISYDLMVDFHTAVNSFALHRKITRLGRPKCYLYFLNLKDIPLLSEIFAALGGYYTELPGRLALYSDLMTEIVDGLEREAREILHSPKYR